MLESWDEIIKRRRQYDCWDLSKELPLETVQEILYEAHTFAAKKQNEPHMEIMAISYDDPKLRDALWNYSTFWERNQTTTNGQTLANYLIVFITKHHHRTPINYIHIGIHSDFIAHAAAARGLQTGFCKCTDDDLTDDQKNYIKQQLNIDSLGNIVLMMGLGYGLENESMIHPITGEIVKCVSRSETEKDYDLETPPDQYIKFF
jgi:nitroreductase